MQMLLDLMDERQKWLGKRDEAIREISRLSELIRATMNMIPPEQLGRYEPIFERIEQRPPGLSMAIRACFTAGRVSTSSGLSGENMPGIANLAGKEWLSPVEIRDVLKRMGFPFENYKANPLASIHTTLKRMVPGELETKTLKDGQKVYRLKSAAEWQEAFAEMRQWFQDEFHLIKSPMGGGAVVVKRSPKKPNEEEAKKETPPKGEKHGAH
jgi:hypothetical protein